MKYFKYKLTSALCLSALALTGCKDDNSSTAQPMTNVSGTAAIGSPIVAAKIDLKCNGYDKDSAATTDALGKWSASIPTAQLPCAARLTGGKIGITPNTQKLYSMTSGVGTNTIANITPLVDLILAKTVNTSTGASLDSWYAGTSLASTLNTILAQLAANITTVLNQLSTQGYTLPTGSSFNPFSSPFTPTTSNSYDQLLEQIGHAIAASSSLTYAQFKANYLTGTSIPAAPITTTPPASGETCASKKLPSTTLAAIADYDGDYKDAGITVFSLKTATASAVVKNTQSASIQEVCGPNVQSNGTNHVLITNKGNVTLFKNNQGTYSAEGLEFTNPAQTFFGEKSNSTAAANCESSGADDKLGFKNAPTDFCSFSKLTSVAITSPDIYTFFNADKTENVKVTVDGTTVKSIAIENNNYAWACGIGSLTTCSGVSFSASNNYKQISFNNTTLDVVNGASNALIVKNGLLIHFVTTSVTPPVTPSNQVFSLNTAACTVASTGDMNLFWQCHENVIQDMNLTLKTLAGAPCNIQKVGALVTVTVGGKTISDSFNADNDDALGIPNPTGPIASAESSIIVKTYGKVEIDFGFKKDGTLSSVIATQTSPAVQFACIPN